MAYTKKEILGMFKRLIKAMQHFPELGQVDCMGLDHNATYAGYVLVEYGPMGSERYPFGLKRSNGSEIYAAMFMTAQTLEKIEENRE